MQYRKKESSPTGIHGAGSWGFLLIVFPCSVVSNRHHGVLLKTSDSVPVFGPRTEASQPKTENRCLYLGSGFSLSCTPNRPKVEPLIPSALIILIPHSAKSITGFLLNSPAEPFYVLSFYNLSQRPQYQQERNCQELLITCQQCQDIWKPLS